MLAPPEQEGAVHESNRIKRERIVSAKDIPLEREPEGVVSTIVTSVREIANPEKILLATSAVVAFAGKGSLEALIIAASLGSIAAVLAAIRDGTFTSERYRETPSPGATKNEGDA
jgi:hypothetical protein